MARGGLGDRVNTLFGTPSRFMQPRVILYVATFTLVSFGLLMIYSSSSIEAMMSDDNAAYYLERQLLFVGAGIFAAGVVAVSDYHFWSRSFLPLIWVASVALLILVFTPVAGRDAYGAARWIYVAGFNLQPSEFVKVTVILTAANIAARYFEDGSLTFDRFVELMVIGVGVPLLLIVMQPDKGTTIICAATIIVMAYLAGIPRQTILIACGVVLVSVAVLALKDEYSRARVLTMLNPQKDPYGDGYQLMQGFYAFASGGLFGVGVGLSRQKYLYLPMAYNDFIFAIIGEEMGLMGTLGVLVAFGLIAWAGLQIARYAPDLSGRLIAAGCTSMLLIQTLVNIGGVLGMIPLTGKPLPFLSYGGSSIISCLLLVGFIVSVSTHSSLPETAFERRRREWSVADDEADARGEYALVGEATPRSARAAGDTGFSVVSSPRAGRVGSAVLPGREGDTSVEGIRASRAFSEAHASGRVSTDTSGRQRIDLGPSAADRLRSSRGKSN